MLSVGANQRVVGLRNNDAILPTHKHTQPSATLRHAALAFEYRAHHRNRTTDTQGIRAGRRAGLR